MYAHINEMAGERSIEDSTLSREARWGMDLGGRQIGALESHFQSSAANVDYIPTDHSARLCLFVEKCLRHNIEHRPSLEEVSNLCQNELTRLDSIPGASAGRRKRGDDDEADERSALQTGENDWHPNFDRFRSGNAFSLKRQRTSLDLGDHHPQREAYSQLVTAWANMPQPTLEAQDNAIDVIHTYLLDFNYGQPMGDEGQPMGDEEDEEYVWAAKHLISCLRKRQDPKGGAYVLDGKYIDNYGEPDWMKSAWEPPIKIAILEHLPSFEDFQEGYSTGDQERTDALAALRIAMQWGLMMLRDIRTPPEFDMTGNDVGSRPAEPREPKMRNQSALHKGVYDWIFVHYVSLLQKLGATSPGHHGMNALSTDCFLVWRFGIPPLSILAHSIIFLPRSFS